MRWTFLALFVLALLLETSAPVHGQNVQRVRRLVAGRVAAPSTPENPEEKGDETGDEDQSADGVPIFFFRDGSKVAGEPRVDRLVVTTRYGPLSVPRNELVRVRFVPRVDPDVKDRVVGLIAQLGSQDFDEREAAYEELLGVGPDALPQIRKAVSSENEEVRNRAELLVSELQKEAEKKAEELGVKDSPNELKGSLDEVVTNRMVIRGTVELERVEIQSRYGGLRVDVADLVEISFQKAGPSHAKLDVLPKYQPNGEWLDSKLSLEKNQRFLIEAGGSMTVSNYGVSCGPTGTTQWSSGNAFNNYPLLSLVGKVGKNGKPFLIGSNYKGKATSNGHLYLSVVPFVYDVDGVTGKYTATVRLQDK